MIRKILFSIAMLFSLGIASAQVKFYDVTTDELRELGKEQEKLIFIDIYATWCPPCRAMEANVFSREDIGEFMAQRFVSAKYNIDEGIGRQLADKYGIKSIPTYLIFDLEGNLQGTMQGSRTPEDFMVYIKHLLYE
ncbi:MAG: thioredoxin family protein [Rikenellaceae bacterium]